MPDSPDADDALTCPLCGYDLRGLPANRCPECGHAFDPAELRAARDARRAWFFEHAPRDLRARAFGLTTRATLNPIRFWGRLKAADASSPGRLVLWACAWALIGPFAVASIVLLPIRPFQAIKSYIAFPPSPIMVGAAFAAWPVVSLAALQVFNGTLRRANVRAIHRWRCVLYPLPCLAAIAIAYAVLAAVLELEGTRDYVWPGWARAVADASPKVVGQVLELTAIPPTAAVVIALGAIVTVAHFVMAHVRYLRIRHAAGQALLAQAAAWTLIAMALIIVCGRL